MNYILGQINAAFKSGTKSAAAGAVEGQPGSVAKNGKIKLREINPLLRKNTALKENNYF